MGEAIRAYNNSNTQSKKKNKAIMVMHRKLILPPGIVFISNIK